MDRDYRLTAFNASFSKRFRDDAKLLPELGMDLRDIYGQSPFFSQCGPGCAKALERFANTSLHTFQKDGYLQVHEFSFQPFTDSNGTLMGCSVWQKDITQEMENVHRLRESEIKYKEAQELANVGHWNWDMKLDKLNWSDQLFRIFGQDPGKFKGTFDSLLEIVHPDDREAFNASVSGSIQNNLPLDWVHRIMLESKEVRYIHEKGRVFYDPEGSPFR